MTMRFVSVVGGGLLAAMLMVLPGTAVAKGPKTTACQGLSGGPLATCIKYCDKLKCLEAADPKCTDLLEKFERETGQRIVPCEPCGNGTCGFGETAATCPEDCAIVNPE
jgi:hypothetical protein